MYGLRLSRFERTMRRAECLAAEHGNRIIGVHHLVEVVLAESSILALLQSCGVDVPAGSRPYSSLPELGADGMDITPGVRRVLEMAHYEAEAAGERHVLADHVLLALLDAAKEAKVNHAWYPYVGCVASLEERKALLDLRACLHDEARLRAVIADLPRRTLLRAAEEGDDRLLRPAGGQGSADHLLHPVHNAELTQASRRSDELLETENPK